MTSPDPGPDSGPDPVAPALSGRSVVVCRAEVDAPSLLAELTRLGAEPVLVPLHQRGRPADGGDALDAALARLDAYQWLALTSANGVRALAEALAAAQVPIPPEVRVAVVGRATAAVAADAGLTVELVPPVATAADLAAAFPPDPDPGQRVLALVAEAASTDLEAGLTVRGYAVDRVSAYRMDSVPVTPEAATRLAGADAILLTAPSLVDRLAAVCEPDAIPSTVIAIGPRTAARARRWGLDPVVANSHDEAGLVRALLSTFAP